MTISSALRSAREAVERGWFGQPRWLRRIFAWGTVAVGALLIFLIGFTVAHRQLPPYEILAKIDQKLTAPFRSAARPALTSQRYGTTLLTLKSDVGVVNTGLGASGNTRLYEHGGGMTSLGEDVLLLTYTGRIFAARSGSDIRETGIQAPDNGRAAYLAAADAPDTDLNFHRGYLRYNDLEFVDTPVFTGLIATYSEFHADNQCTTNTLATLALPHGLQAIDDIASDGTDWQILFRASPCLPLKDKHLAVEGQMAGGQVLLTGPNTVLLTSGDYHLDGMRAAGDPIAQDAAADYGKVIAINLETGAARHVSAGHRNMQGIAMGSDGEVYITEHGPRGGDELNRIIEGANYGWPRVSLGTAYSGTPLASAGELGRHDGFEAPVMAWVPSIAVSGLTRVNGFHPAWQGDFVATSLRDRALYRIRMDNGHVQYTERIALNQRLRAIHQHTDGRIVIWTDNQELVFLSAADLDTTAERLPDFIAGMDAPASVRSGFETAIARCIECHSLADGDHANAPSLARIFGAPVAATSYAGYSDALIDVDGNWDRARLEAFLADPQAIAPGTFMPPADTNDPRVIRGLVDYLEHLDQQF